MTSEDTVESPLMSVQFFITSKSFSSRVTSILLFSFLLQGTLKSIFLPHYGYLKLKNDTNYLMISEDAVEDPLMSVQFYIKSLVFSFRVTVHLLFSFLLQKTLKSVFLQRYEFLKLNHDTNYLITSEDTVEDPVMCVEFYIKSMSFFISCDSPSTVFIFIAKDA